MTEKCKYGNEHLSGGTCYLCFAEANPRNIKDMKVNEMNPTCKHGYEYPFCKDCYILNRFEVKNMSGCVPISEPEISNELQFKVNRLELEVGLLKHKVEKLKDVITTIVQEI